MLFLCNAEDAYNSCENLRAAANPNQPRRQSEASIAIAALLHHDRQEFSGLAAGFGGVSDKCSSSFGKPGRQDSHYSF